MKASILIFLLPTFFSLPLLASKPISFLDAINAKKIKVFNVETTGLGTNNLSFNIQSLSNEPLTIIFEPGLLFVPKDEHFQQLLFTDSIPLLVNARGLAIANLTAYCTQPSNMGPRTIAGYNTFQQADEGLVGLATLIHRHELVERQSLIWTFVNKSKSYSFPKYPENTQEAIKGFIQKYFPTALLQFGDAMPSYAANVVSIAANLAFMNEEAVTLNFEISTESGQLVRRVFENKKYEPGAHIIKFGLNDFFPKGTNFVARLINQEGAVYQEMPVNEETPYQEMEVYQISYNYKFIVKQPIENASIILYKPDGERLRVVKTYDTLKAAFHDVNFSFYHYYHPKSKFVVELVDSEGKVYDKTEFDAYKVTKKLYQMWK